MVPAIPHSLTYRPDIDGLRAVAVLSVIIFHAFPGVLPGGFVGVDIFFVISGYLIVSIILRNDLTSSAFLKSFYDRRIRRLIPPALPVVLFTLVAGFLLLPPDGIREMAWSVIAYAVFLSNWFFLEQAGYFDGPSHLKPMLHTWSLSVEEQFYLVFPIIVLVFRSFGRIWMMALFTTVIIASYAYGSHRVATGEVDAAFFDSFARFWQIAAGGWLASFVWQGRNQGSYGLASRGLREVAGSVGFVTTIAAIVLIDPSVAFPDPLSILPVLGPVLLILAGTLPDDGSVGAASDVAQSLPLTSRLLSIRPMVAIGLISYALYLWHWPLLVYARVAIGNITAAHLIAAIALTFALAAVSYRIIEVPVRARGRELPKRISYLGFVGSTLAVISAAALTMGSIGVVDRFQSAEQYSQERSRQLETFYARTKRDTCWVTHTVDLAPVIAECVTFDPDRIDILLVGDSHSAHLLPGLRKTFSKANFSLLAVDSCIVTERDIPDRPACDELNDWLASTDLGRFDAVFLSSRNMARPPNPQDISHVARLSRQAPVYMFGPIQYYLEEMPTLYASHIGSRPRDEIEMLFESVLDKDVFERSRQLAELTSELERVTYVPLIDIMCPDTRCDHFDEAGRPVLVDASHMSVTVSEALAESLIAPLSTVLEPDRFEIRTLADFPPLSPWSALTAATLDVSENGFEVALDPDGRIQYQHDFRGNTPSVEMVFTASVESFLDVPQTMDIILQNGCTHVVESGRSFNTDITPGEQRIDLATRVATTYDCYQIRVWARGENTLRAEFTDIEIALKTYLD